MNYLQNNTLNRHNVNEPNRKRWSSCFLLSSFTLGLVADGGSRLTVDILFLAVDNEEQRRVNSYASEVKQLPERGNMNVRQLRETN